LPPKKFKIIFPRSVYKPHFVQRKRLGDHLSGILVTQYLLQPTRDSNETSSLLSLLGLAPGGGYLAANITIHAGSLLHYLFTVARNEQSFPRAVYFCGPIQQISPLRVLPDTKLYGVRTFLRRSIYFSCNRPTNLGQSDNTC